MGYWFEIGDGEYARMVASVLERAVLRDALEGADSILHTAIYRNTQSRRIRSDKYRRHAQTPQGTLLGFDAEVPEQDTMSFE